MRERNELILADLIALRAEQKPDLDVLTFEHFSLDGGATPDEVRSYADLFTNANRIAAWLIARGMQPGDRFVITLRNHPEFGEAMIAAMLKAPNAEEFTAATKALDRVLTSGRYVIPIWYSDLSRLAYSADLKYPEKIPLYGDWTGFLPDTWWFEAK